MAETTITYVSLRRLAYYHAGLKTIIDNADAATLAAAKAYAEQYFNDNSDNFDPAGAAQTVYEQLKAEVDKNTAAIAKLNGADTEEGSVAKAVKDAKDELQGEIGTLEEYVGKIPETATATDIVGYVQEKTAGIATDTALEELTGRVADAETAIENIEKDYLVEADKTELSDAIAAEKTRAEGIEAGLRTDVDAVTGKVTTLVGDDTGKSARTIANEELAKQLIAENAKESLDTLSEIAAWIQAHPDDAAAMSKAIDDLEALVGTLPEGVEATTIVGYIQEIVKAEEDRAIAAENALDLRLDAVEAQLGTGEGSVEEKIAAAKEEAVKHADDLNTAMDTRVQAVEGKAHEHTNKDLLDTYTQTEENLADAVAKKHAHENAAELAKVAEGDVAKWNASEQNAKDYADAEIDKVEATIGTVTEGKTVVDMINDAQTAATYNDEEVRGLITANDEAIDALAETHNTDKAALEAADTAMAADIEALKAVQHVEITEAELDAILNGTTA